MTRPQIAPAATAPPKKRARKPVPENETKGQKFVRLVVPRVNRAAKALQSVAKMSARSYEYTPDQAAKIIEMLRAELNVLVKAFDSNGTPERGGFSL